MTYTVVWRPSAERRLAEIWTIADDRQTVTDATNAIDALLRATPLEVGESRVANVRILTVLPLSVYYDVHEDDRLVAVWESGVFADGRKGILTRVPQMPYHDPDLASDLAALREANPKTRMKAAEKIGETRHCRAVEPLHERLRDEDSEVRAMAAWALGEIGDKRAADTLRDLCADTSEHVRTEASAALKKLQSSQGVRNLLPSRAAHSAAGSPNTEGKPQTYNTGRVEGPSGRGIRRLLHAVLRLLKIRRRGIARQKYLTSDHIHVPLESASLRSAESMHTVSLQNSSQTVCFRASKQEFIADCVAGRRSSVTVSIAEVPALHDAIGRGLLATGIPSHRVVEMRARSLSAACPECGVGISGAGLAQFSLLMAEGLERWRVVGPGRIYRLAEGRCPNFQCSGRQFTLCWAAHASGGTL